MPTQEEIDERERELNRLEEEQRGVQSEEIPQRRFGSRVTREQQQNVLQRRQSAGENIEQINKQRSELSAIRQQLEEIRRYEQDVKIAKLVLRGKAPVFALDSRRRRELYRQFLSNKKIIEGNAEARRRLQEQGLTPIIIKGKVAGYRDEVRGQSITNDQLIEIARESPQELQRFEKAGVLNVLPPVPTIREEAQRQSLPAGEREEVVQTLRPSPEEERRGQSLPVEEQPLIDEEFTSEAPRGVVGVAPTTKEQFQKSVEDRGFISGSLFFAGEKAQGLFGEAERRFTPRSQSLASTGAVSRAVQIAPLFTPLGIGASLSISQGLETLSRDFITHRQQFDKLSTQEKVTEVSLATLGSVTGAFLLPKQLNKALRFPKFESNIVTKPLMFKTIGEGDLEQVVIKSQSNIVIKQRNLFSTKIFLARSEELSKIENIDDSSLIIRTVAKSRTREINVLQVLSRPTKLKVIGKPETSSISMGVGTAKIKELGELTLIRQSDLLKTFVGGSKDENLLSLSQSISVKEGRETLTAGVTVPIVRRIFPDPELTLFARVRARKAGRGTFLGKILDFGDDEVKFLDKFVQSETKAPVFNLKNRLFIEQQDIAVQSAINNILGSQKSSKVSQSSLNIITNVKTNLQPRTKLVKQNFQIQKQELVSINKTVSQQKFDQRFELVTIRVSKSALKLSPLSKSKTALREQSLPAFKIALKSLLKANEKTILKTPARIVTRQPPTRTTKAPPIIAFGFFKKEFKSKDKISINKAFKTFVIKGGNKVFLEGIAPRGRALRKGQEFTTKTLRATFGIEPTNVKIKQKDINFQPSQKIFREFKIRQGKQIPLNDIFIQRTRKEKGLKGGRLSFGGEISEIQLRRAMKLL